MEPEYLTAYVATVDGIVLMDVVRWNGELWLVPEWLEWPEQQLQTPAVAVRLDLLPHQSTRLGGVDFVVNNPIPTAVLSGEISPEAAQPFQVMHGPSPHFGNWAVPVRQ